MVVQIVRHFWRTVFTHVVWRRGQMVHLLPKHPRAKRRVRQHANAEDKICRITVGVNEIIGQRQLYAQARIACRQAGKSWGYVLLAEKHRSVNADRTGRLHRTRVQLPARLFKILRHRPGVANKQMTAFRGNDGPRIAIEKLLPERILELVDHARYLRGRYPLPPRHDGEVLRFIHVDKDQQRADVDVAGVNH